MWLTAATLHLEGDAAHWFQSYKLKHAVQGWPDFIMWWKQNSGCMITVSLWMNYWH
jgi:hypothetical protein